MLICLGLDHRNADIRTRERFLPDEERIRAIRSGPLPSPLLEAGVLPTCNRLELYAWATGGRGGIAIRAAARSAARLWADSPDEARALLECAVLRVDEDAAVHLFRVAAGLESQVLGDMHILGQVRKAFRESRDSPSMGPHLHRLFEMALRCGRAVKRDTVLMAGRRSVGSEAAGLLLRRAGREDGGGRWVVVGTGKIGSHAAHALARARPHELVLVNRTPSRAQALAAALGIPGVRVVPFAGLHEALAEADGALVATGAGTHVVRAPLLHAARADAGTAGRPLVVVDASMPRNADPRCGGLPGVTVLDLDALETGTAAVERARQAAVPAARTLVAHHAAEYRQWQAESSAREALRPLREVLSDVCRREVGFAAGEDVAGRATSRIVAKLLAGPMTALRRASERGESVEELAGALRQLFPPAGRPEEDSPRA